MTPSRAPLMEPRSPASATRPQTAWSLNQRFAERKLPLACPTVRSPAAWRTWRTRLRRALRDTLTLNAFGSVPIPTMTVLKTERDHGVTRLHIAYQTRPLEWVTAYLLIPDADRPLMIDGVAHQATKRRPAVICAHGHFPGGKASVALDSHAHGVAYGAALARLGCVVLAPDNAGMGERDVADKKRTLRGDNGGNGCFLAWSRFNHLGLDLTGARIFDLMAGLSLLAARADVDATRIGAAGLSGGCWLSQVLAAVDDRIAATVLSGYFSTFAQTAWHGHCVCHHPFGIGAYCEMPDIAALIAPRPLFIESGSTDVQYPHEPAYTATHAAYALCGAADRIDLHRYRGGHLFHGGRSLPWLMRQLGK